MNTKQIIRHVAVFLALLVFLPFSLPAKNVIRTEYGVVMKVSDGDSIEAITDNGTKLKIRLYGIDAPETAKGRNGVIGKQGQPPLISNHPHLTKITYRIYGY